MADIGAMFGVSRERVRQWCVQHNVQRPESGTLMVGLNALRIWDDNLNRFIPISRGKYLLKVQAEAVEKRREAYWERVFKRREEIVEKIKVLKEDLGRDPTVHEMAERVLDRAISGNQAGVLLAGKWGRGDYKTYKEILDDIRERSGVSPRPAGHQGHRWPQFGARPKDFCKRGHYKGKGKLCRICNNWRVRRGYNRVHGKPLPPEPKGDFTYPEEK